MKLIETPAFWQHSGYILATFWLSSGYILATFWLHSGYISAIFQLHCGGIPAILWLHSDYMLTTFWLFLTNWLSDGEGGLTSRTFDLLLRLIIYLKRSIDLDPVLSFILRWSCYMKDWYFPAHEIVSKLKNGISKICWMLWIMHCH